MRVENFDKNKFEKLNKSYGGIFRLLNKVEDFIGKKLFRNGKKEKNGYVLKAFATEETLDPTRRNGGDF